MFIIKKNKKYFFINTMYVKSNKNKIIPYKNPTNYYK